MRRFNSWSTVVLLSWAATVYAAEGWWAVGVGNFSCGAFVKAEAAMTYVPEGQTHTLNYEGKTWVEYGLAFDEWILGFVTASNLARADASKQIMIDRDGTLLWVRKYCEEHPDENLVVAAGAFVRKQREKLK